MQLLSRNPNFDFMKYRRVAMTASGIASAVSILWVIFHGLNYGIDFTGGVLVEVSYPKEANLVEIRSELEAAGITQAQVQTVGALTDVLIRLPPIGGDGTDAATTRDRLLEILRTRDPDVQPRGAEVVSSQVGAELAQQGGLAMLFALIMIFIYVMLRFRWKLALGAVVATVHDVTVTVGMFAIFGWQFDLIVLGSVLAVLGYSLMDTIVVYDRIRDNFRLMRRGSPAAIVNASVNQTLSRTIVTSVTTLLVVTALFFLGGETLWGFSLALIIGIVVGTYSSIYIASAMALALNVTPADLVAVKAEKVDELP
jgi:preprotein translocase subunit SecF